MNVLEPGKWAFHLSWKRKSCSVGFYEARPRGTMGDQLRGVLGTCYPPALLLPGQERLNCHCWATLGPPHQLHLAIVTMLTRKQKTSKIKKHQKYISLRSVRWRILVSQESSVCLSANF